MKKLIVIDGGSDSVWSPFEQRLLVRALHNIDNSYCPIFFRIKQRFSYPRMELCWLKKYLKGWSK